MWKLEELRFSHEFLTERVVAKADGYNYVHNNADVWSALNRMQPEVVITTGLNPTHLYAFAWTQLRGVRHVYMTDGTLFSEANLGWRHRMLRRGVFARTSAFVVASIGGIELLANYGIDRKRVFISRLCADNARHTPLPVCRREFDVMFSGRLHDGKLPFFFAEVCASLVRLRGRCRALVIGDGPLRQQVLERMATDGVDITYPGFVQPAALAPWYARSRLLLLTTRRDAWGVVANEAMASGTPVICTPQAGAAGDLVIDGVTGRVLPAELEGWVQTCAELLGDDRRWEMLSEAARLKVAEYTYDVAAEAIVDGCRYAQDRR